MGGILFKYQKKIIKKIYFLFFSSCEKRCLKRSYYLLLRLSISFVLSSSFIVSLFLKLEQNLTSLNSLQHFIFNSVAMDWYLDRVSLLDVQRATRTSNRKFVIRGLMRLLSKMRSMPQF